MRNNIRNDRRGYWWVIAFFLFAIAIVFLLLYFSVDGNHQLYVLTGVLGSYISLFSLVLMFAQFKSIRDISSETRNKMDSIISVSNLAKHAELARSAQSDVIQEKDELAIYKIQIIKESLIKLERRDDSDSKAIALYCGKLGTHITNLRFQQTKIRRQVIADDLEQIADYLLRQEESIKEKSN